MIIVTIMQFIETYGCFFSQVTDHCLTHTESILNVLDANLTWGSHIEKLHKQDRRWKINI